MDNFRSVTEMELKYVLIDGANVNAQRIFELRNAFEQRVIAVIVLGQDIPGVLNANHMPTDGALRGILVVNYNELDPAAEKAWSKKFKSMKFTRVKSKSLTIYLNEHTMVSAVATRIVAETNVATITGAPETRTVTESTPPATRWSRTLSRNMSAASATPLPNGFTLVFKGIANFNVLKYGYHPNAAVLVTVYEVLSFRDKCHEAVMDGMVLVLSIDTDVMAYLLQTDLLTQLNQTMTGASNNYGPWFSYYALTEGAVATFPFCGIFRDATEITLRPFGDGSALNGVLLVDLEVEKPARVLRELDELLDEREVRPFDFRAYTNPATVVPVSPTEVQKRNCFRQMVARTAFAFYSNQLLINVTRQNVLNDSVQALLQVSDNDINTKSINVRFIGELGADSGGLTREWYGLIAAQIFNPDFELFKSSETNQNAFKPFEGSIVHPNHLKTFNFIGKVIGMGLIDDIQLNCHFTKSFYKQILGIKPTLNDLLEVDADFHQSLVWISDNDLTGTLKDTSFTVTVKDLGHHRDVELKQNGANILLTEENKHEYVRLMVEFRLETSIQAQVNAFMDGFHRIVPRHLLEDFTVSELERLISGAVEINVDDWQANSGYSKGYHRDHKVVLWFWRALRSFSQPERRAVLKFVTGSPSIPLEGFSHLRNRGQIVQFNITRDNRSTELLPVAHTCFNCIDLPEYESYGKLRKKLLLAITEGNDAFMLL